MPSVGWRDANWLEQDPEMRPLLHEPRLIGFIEQVRRSPAVDVTIQARDEH
jgi:hypothetical protein